MKDVPDSPRPTLPGGMLSRRICWWVPPGSARGPGAVSGPANGPSGQAQRGISARAARSEGYSDGVRLDGRPYRGGLPGEGLALRPGFRLRGRRRDDPRRAAFSRAAPVQAALLGWDATASPDSPSRRLACRTCGFMISVTRLRRCGWALGLTRWWCSGCWAYHGDDDNGPARASGRCEPVAGCSACRGISGAS